MFRWLWLCLCLWMVALPSAHAAGVESATDEAEALILRKLAEDSAYFKFILAEQKAGRTGDLDASTFATEVKRAQGLEPVIDYIVNTARKNSDGERVDLARVRAKAGGSYVQLATMLNLIGTVRADDYLRAEELARQVDLSVGFGPTQSIEGYRTALTRHYYYLRAVALYHAHEDADAVKWFGQIDADTEVRAMNMRKKKEIESLRLADLSERPIAVTAFANTKEDEDNAWMGLALADGVTNDLVRFTNLGVVERTRLQAVMEELSLGLMGVVNEKHAVEVGQGLQAGTLVYGSFLVEDDVVTVQGRLVHVESGAVLQAATVKSAPDEIFEASRELTMQLLGDAGLITAVEKMKIAGGRKPTRSAVRALANARLAAASNPDAARELFEEAMENDPEYANAHDALRAQFADVSAKVAVLPLRNTTAKEDDAWLSDGFAELLGRDLPVLGFSTVERAEMRRVMTYQLALMGAEEAGGDILADGAMDLAAMGEQVAANFLLLGGFQHLGDELKVSVRFVDVGSGEVLYTAGAEGPMADYGQLVTDIISELGLAVGRKLDADALAEMTEGKPSLEEFEKFMRGELAKDALTSDDAKAEGEQARLEQRSEERKRLEEQLMERMAEANRSARTRRVIGAGGVVAGSSMAAVGLVLGSMDRFQAGQASDRYETSVRDEEKQAAYDDWVRLHKRANTMQTVGVAGVGLAVISTGVMLIGGDGKPDLDGIDLGGATAQFDLAPTFGTRGAMASMHLRF